MSSGRSLVQSLVDDVWSSTDASRAEAMVAPEAQVHLLPFPDGVGVDAMLAGITTLRNAMPDLSVASDVVFGSGPRIAVHYNFRGTHTGAALFGAPAGGREITGSGVAFFTVEDGRIVRAEGLLDGAGMMQQLYAAE